MKNKLWLVNGEAKRRLQLPEPHADHALYGESCPNCGAEECKLQGTNKRIAADDRAYESDAVAACCSGYMGTLRLEVSTLFGLREDRAVLQGRARVY